MTFTAGNHRERKETDADADTETEADKETDTVTETISRGCVTLYEHIRMKETQK